MKQIEKTTISLIKKYAEYRGALDERLTYDILLEVYTNADKKDRAIYMKEMKTYISAVESGKIEKGVPIEVLELSS
jgi:hypothetical protein